MSPPKFEAYNKPHSNVQMPEPEKDNEKNEKQPEVITTPEAAPSCRGGKCRRMLKKRCGCCRGCKWFVVLSCVVVITAGVLGIVAIKKHFKLAHKQIIKHNAVVAGRLYPEVYEVDYDHKVISSRNSYTGLIAPADVLADFNKRLEVYRDNENGACYIDKLKSSFEESLFYISAKEASPRETGEVIRSMNPIEDKVVKKFAGPRIAKHCKGLPTYWIVGVEDRHPEPMPEPPTPTAGPLSAFTTDTTRRR